METTATPDQVSPPRPVYEIAREIVHLWRDQFKTASAKNKAPARFARRAWPYLEAMHHLHTTARTEKYGLEDAQMIVLYFLSNAQPWRGENARRIKAELNAMLKQQNPGD